MDEEKIDKEFIQIEEFLDLFQKSLRSVMQSSSKQKTKFILGLLVEILHIDKATDFPILYKESFLFLIDQLNN